MSSLPQWTFDDLFSSPEDPRITQAFTEARAKTDALCTRYKGKLASGNAQDILELFKAQEDVMNLLTKPVSYASLRHAQNMRDSEREGFSRVMQERATAIERDLLWIDLELVSVPEATLQSWVQDPALTHYRHVLGKILLNKPHLLSEELEQLANDLHQTGASAFIQLFEQEDSTKLYAYQNEHLPLTRLLKELSSPDRSTRKAAGEAIAQGLEEDAQRRAFLYTTLIKNKQTMDRYRHFSSPETSRHLANETTEASVNALVESVNRTMPLFQEYYQWKTKKLGETKLAYYDRYAPLDASSRTYTFDEAKGIILEAFGAFSPEFSRIAQEFFDRGWVDAEPTPGKRGGAFCAYTSADHHPYIFVNFQGRINDVLTLAHELGHGIHAYLARPQGTLQFHTPLTLAETASVFAEMIVFDHLRQQLQTDPKELQALCAHKIESVFSTVFRQITLFQFERLAHAHVREHGFATAETYNDLWSRVHTALFGDVFESTPGYRVYWSYISHFFFAPFYVYAYAYGELLTCALYERYTREQDPEMIKRYQAFLAKGGSDTPEALLAPLGVNPTEQSTWDTGLAWIEKLLKETIALDEQISE